MSVVRFLCGREGKEMKLAIISGRGVDGWVGGGWLPRYITIEQVG